MARPAAAPPVEVVAKAVVHVVMAQAGLEAVVRVAHLALAREVVKVVVLGATLVVVRSVGSVAGSVADWEAVMVVTKAAVSKAEEAMVRAV